MSIFSGYKEVVELVQKMNNNSHNLSGYEIDIIKQLDSLILEDRTYKLVNDIFKNNRDLNRLIKKIDNQILQLTSKIEESNNRLSKRVKDEDLFEIDKCRKKIQGLEKLKNDIVDYTNSKSDNKTDNYRLVSLALLALSNGFFDFDDYFGMKLGDLDSNNDSHFSLNSDIVNKVYSIINDSNFMEQLQLGVDLVDENKDLLKLLEVCSSALDKKSLVYNNMDKIFVYNIFTSQLTDMKFELADDKYKDLDIKLRTVEERLERFDSFELLKFIKKDELNCLIDERKRILVLMEDLEHLNSYSDFLDGELKLLKKDFASIGLIFGSGRKVRDASEKLLLERNIGNFCDKEELDEYYNNIINTYRKCKSALNSSDLVKKKYIDSTDNRVLDLLASDYDTASNLVKLYRRREIGGISPIFALFILKVIVTLDNSDVRNMGITSKQYNDVRNYYIDDIMDNYNKFNREYNNIIYFGGSRVEKKK